MRISYKILLLAAAVLIVSIAAGIGVYSYSVTKVKHGLTYFHNQMVQGEGNVETLDMKYGKLGLQFPFGLRTKNLQMDILTTGSDQHVRITSGLIGAQLKGVPSGVLKVSAKDINMASGKTDKPLLSNQFHIRNIEVYSAEYETRVSVFNPERSMRRVYGHLAELIQRGDTKGKLKMEGTVYFDFGKNQLYSQRFSTRKDGQVHRIVLNREDLEHVAPKFGSRLSEGDIDLVANHPLKAPRLLEIRQETEEKARELRWAQRNFPEDVYRHVLWSYLLTKEYGKEFASLVTNAHELGSYNSEEEMEKDRQNNRVGMAYAEEGINESKILHRIRTDPRVQF